MVQCTISLLAAVPTTLVHALNFFVATPGTLVLLRAGNGHERVNGGERVAALKDASVECLNRCAHARERVKRVVTYWRRTRDVVRDHGRRSAARGRR